MRLIERRKKSFILQTNTHTQIGFCFSVQSVPRSTRGVCHIQKCCNQSTCSLWWLSLVLCHRSLLCVVYFLRVCLFFFFFILSISLHFSPVCCFILHHHQPPFNHCHHHLTISKPSFQHQLYVPVVLSAEKIRIISVH